MERGASGGMRMTYLLLSKRLENAKITCSKCSRNVDGWCKYPILMKFKEGTVRATKLIHLSDDGLTCQLFKEAMDQ